MEQSFLNIFESKPYAPLASANATMTHFEYNQPLQANFLVFYNNLVS